MNIKIKIFTTIISLTVISLTAFVGISTAIVRAETVQLSRCPDGRYVASMTSCTKQPTSSSGTYQSTSPATTYTQNTAPQTNTTHSTTTTSSYKPAYTYHVQPTVSPVQKVYVQQPQQTYVKSYTYVPTPVPTQYVVYTHPEEKQVTRYCPDTAYWDDTINTCRNKPAAKQTAVAAVTYSTPVPVPTELPSTGPSMAVSATLLGIIGSLLAYKVISR